jgi:hypothetical protein
VSAARGSEAATPFLDRVRVPFAKQAELQGDRGKGALSLDFVETKKQAPQPHPYLL